MHAEKRIRSGAILVFLFVRQASLNRWSKRYTLGSHPRLCKSSNISWLHDPHRSPSIPPPCPLHALTVALGVPLWHGSGCPWHSKDGGSSGCRVGFGGREEDGVGGCAGDSVERGLHHWISNAKAPPLQKPQHSLIKQSWTGANEFSQNRSIE